MTKKNMIRMAISAVALVLIIYTLYHIIWGTRESVKTTPAGLVSETESAVFEGIIVRDEKTVSSKFSGEINYLVSNGAKIDAGAPFAEVYSQKASTDIFLLIEELKERLEILKESNHKGNVSVNDIEKLNKRTEDIYSALMLAANDKDTVKAAQLERELLICLNKKQIFEGNIENYDSEIEKTETDIKTLYQSFGESKETLSTEESCYFYYHTDGYEGEFNTENMYSFSPEELKNKISEIKNSDIKKGAFVGKTAVDHKWYLVTPCDEKTAEKLNEGSYYDAVFFDTKEFDISLKLEKISASDEEGATLVFSSEVIPYGFEFDRVQAFKIEVSSLRGYRVPRDSLVKNKNGEYGVYVLNSSIVYFKKVNIIAAYDSYYVVAECDKELKNYREYLDINDLIITSNIDEIYEGMLLKK